ncbi:hypothetical protein [Bradyrhizobium sp. WSM3983]|uniref:hypothetical protein n=1 Tax=Bradyrhizobium sp. WSM3983 TaxID=1038867 RepID=UPI001FD95D13|nr:hypothetical protein [Bradyrhizobium sp. WSM3983]
MVELIVAAAGIAGPLKNAIELEEDKFDLLFDVNVKGGGLAAKYLISANARARSLFGRAVFFGGRSARFTRVVGLFGHEGCRNAPDEEPCAQSPDRKRPR